MLKTIWEFSKTVIIAVALAIIITSFIKPTLVKGYSMYPTIEPNNYLIVNKVPYILGEPSYRDIIVFKTNIYTDAGEEKELIKRIVGLEGDKIEIKDGQVYLNDEIIYEEYLDPNINSGNMEAIIVPEGCVFVMGDNRPNSLDSRDPAVGMIQKESILGRADLRLYPFDQLGTVNKVK